MTNAAATTANTATTFRAVQLMPAPVTVLALAIAGAHHLGQGPLGVIAVVGVLATLGSALLPAIRPVSERRPLPAPREEDRIS